MRTPLSKVRGLGTARTGTGDFIGMRLTSIVLAVLTVVFIVLIVSQLGRPYADVAATVASPIVSILLLATVLLTAYHMRVGMQTVLEDYVHAEMTKFVLLMTNWVFCWGIGLTCTFAILKIAFGG